MGMAHLALSGDPAEEDESYLPPGESDEISTVTEGPVAISHRTLWSDSDEDLATAISASRSLWRDASNPIAVYSRVAYTTIATTIIRTRCVGLEVCVFAPSGRNPTRSFKNRQRGGHPPKGRVRPGSLADASG